MISIYYLLDLISQYAAWFEILETWPLALAFYEESRQMYWLLGLNFPLKKLDELPYKGIISIYKKLVDKISTTKN